ncbi:MAG: lipopolysaccharide biosynthesis protein [Aeromicrobium sp.]
MANVIRSAANGKTGGAAVALGMMGMNIAVYAFSIVAARSLLPREFGALTALLGIILVGTVAALGLQAATARRIAVAPDRAAEIIAVTTRVTLIVAAGVAAAVALSSFVLTPILKLDSAWPVILCGLTLFPLTIMGAQSGIAQGTRRWGSLTAIYLGNGIGRVVGGSVAIAIQPTVTSAMIGIAVGAWLPVLVGSRLLALYSSAHNHVSRRGLVREALLGTHALLAYFVLSNMDSLIARNLFNGHESGLYASGLILAKAALFFPQFVSVVFFPDLARATSNKTRLRAVSLVAGFGLLVTAGTALMPELALILVGGDKYSEITSRLWLFALSGSVLAVVHLLVFDALARRAHGIVVMLWLAVAAVAALAYGLDVGITGLVITVATVSSVLATVIWFAPAASRAPRRAG